MMNFELDAKIDSYKSCCCCFFFFFFGAVVGIGVVFFFFLASRLGDVLGSGWKKGWFDGDVDQNALIPSVVN